MALRTFAFFGLSLPKENFTTDETLMTQNFWFSLIDKYINETTDETGKKYAKMAKDYIVYSKYASHYNPLTQKAYFVIEFMSERHVEQYKTLIDGIITWANEKYGLIISDEHVKSVSDEVNSIININGYSVHSVIVDGFITNIPRQLGYIS